jgi:ankyrin repeat protein
MSAELRKLAFQGRLDELEAWLACHGSNAVDATDNIGHSALFFAIGNEQVEAAALLLRHGAGPNRADLRGKTPLALVAEPQPIRNPSAAKRLAIARLLLEHGADVACDDRHDNQPLMDAVFHASKGDAEGLALVELLLAHGADPDRRNKSGISPLDFAKKINWKPLLDVLERRLDR